MLTFLKHFVLLAGRKIDASSVGYSASLPKPDIAGGKHNGDGEVITITHEDGNNFIGMF